VQINDYNDVNVAKILFEFLIDGKKLMEQFLKTIKRLINPYFSQPWLL